MMRRILLDAARARAAAKRGGGNMRITFDEEQVAVSNQAAELIAIDDALETLKKVDPRKAQVVELRFFGGLSVEETAEVLGISPQSIKRDWKLARAWLLQEIGGPAVLLRSNGARSSGFIMRRSKGRRASGRPSWRRLVAAIPRCGAESAPC